MIPDKIYINNGGGYTTSPIFSQADANIEYIRKDALIEWVKEHKCVIETHGDERDAYLRGEYSILNSLIDKLNLM